MMTPHICSVHVLFKALQTSKAGFLAVFKGGQKMQAIPMRWKTGFFRITVVLGTSGTARLNSAKNSFLLKQALKWPEESSADRTAMTSVYHKSWILRKTSYGTELKIQCSIQVLAWSPQPASASLEAVLMSSPCCRREKDFQVVSHTIINHYEDFTHNPHCLCCDIWLLCCLCE